MFIAHAHRIGGANPDQVDVSMRSILTIQEGFDTGTESETRQKGSTGKEAGCKCITFDCLDLYAKINV